MQRDGEPSQTAPQRSARRVRPVRLCAPEVVVDRKPDGTLHLKSSRTLPRLSRQADRSPRALGGASARPRVHGGARSGQAAAGAPSPTRKRSRRYGASAASLLTRNLSAERPIVILSGNDLEHALLGLAANYVGIPYAPVSPAYSLISSDFGKLRHIVNLLTPGLVFACDGAQYARAIEAVVPPDVEVVVTRNPLPNRSNAVLRARCRARRRRRGAPARSAPTRSRNSCSPPARPACRRA